MANKRPLNSEELGNRGEKEFDNICSQTKLIVNKVTRDLSGWDFIIDFPQPEGGGKSLDARENGTSLKVQIKCMWMENDDVKFRLSSLEKLAKDPGPSFICFLKFDDQLVCRELYISHLLGENLAIILEKLRIEEAKGKLKINSKEVRLGASKFGTKIEPNGSALEAHLSQSIRSAGDDYFSIKSQELKNAGYNAQRLKISVSFAAPVEKIVEAFLGSGDPLEVTELRGVEERFGIPLPLKDMSGPGILSIRPLVTGSFTVIIRSATGGLPVFIRASSYNIPPNIASNLGGQQIRIDSGLLEIRLKLNSCTITTVEASQESIKATPREWIAHLTALRIMSQGNFVLTLRTKSKNVFSEVIAKSIEGLNVERINSCLNALKKLNNIVAITGAEFSDALSIADIHNSLDHIDLLNRLCFPSENNDPIYIDFDFAKSDLVKDGTAGRFVSFVMLGAKMLVYAVPVSAINFDQHPQVEVDVANGELMEISLIDPEEYEAYVDIFRDTPDAPLLLSRQYKSSSGAFNEMDFSDLE